MRAFRLGAGGRSRPVPPRLTLQPLAGVRGRAERFPPSRRWPCGEGRRAAGRRMGRVRARVCLSWKAACVGGGGKGVFLSPCCRLAIPPGGRRWGGRAGEGKEGCCGLFCVCWAGVASCLPGAWFINGR